MLQGKSKNCSLQRNELIEKYGDKVGFMKTFSPDYQFRICGDTDACLFGDYPTLSQMKTCYGANTPIAWLMPQLYNLSEFCGCKDKLEGNPLKECAFTIATDFFYLKISELMLFFHRFKSGRYGRFYGSVDPLVIMTALREFVIERNESIARHEQEEREKRVNEDREGAITYEEYKKMKEHYEERR